jgi:hypothetical protein
MTLMLLSFLMRTVIPLRYGTAFKKAFRQPHIYSAFARDILGIEFEAKEVFQEYAFHPPVGRVNIRYDLFAEDPTRRVIVEMQHIRDDETLDRFLYYHLIGQVEQVQGSDTYRFQRRVYTVVVLTRLPTKEELKFDVGVLSSKLSTLDGKELKDFGHRLVFVNARAGKEGMPEGVRRWMELIEDSLDEQVDETRYGDPVMREVIEEIQWEKVSGDELFRLKEEAVWENAKEEAKEAEAEFRRMAEEKAKEAEEKAKEAEEKAKEEAEARHQAEEKAKEAEEKAKEAEEKAKEAEEKAKEAEEKAKEAEEKAKEAEEKAKEAEEKAKEAEEKALREAIFDLCELLAMELTEAQRSQVGTLDLSGLHELRSALKQQKRWPSLPSFRCLWPEKSPTGRRGPGGALLKNPPYPRRSVPGGVRSDSWPLPSRVPGSPPTRLAQSQRGRGAGVCLPGVAPKARRGRDLQGPPRSLRREGRGSSSRSSRRDKTLENRAR